MMAAAGERPRGGLNFGSPGHGRRRRLRTHGADLPGAVRTKGTQRRGRRPPVAVIVVAPAAPDAVDEASRPRVSSRRVLVLVLVARVIRRPAHHLSAEPAERVRAVLPWAGTFAPPVSQHRSNTVSILAPLASATGVPACTPETLRATHQQRGRRRGSSWAQ